MLLFRLLEAAVLFFVALVVITQVMLPVLEGKTLFPFFDKKESELESELAHANTDKANADLAKTVQEVKSSIK